MDKLELLRQVYTHDKFVGLAGIKIESVNDERAIVSAETRAEHYNANGKLQGGMLYTLADFAFAVISNWLHPVTVTQCGHISYIRPGLTTRVTAEATETVRVGHNTICKVIVRDDEEQILCVCEFNGFVKDVPMDEWAKKYGFEE